jgi:hypothetical protein
MRIKIKSFCLALVLLAVISSGLPDVQAQSGNRAGLVVRFGDGSLVTRCIEFSESEISGYDLLTRAGLNVVAAFDSGMGAAICAIEGTGCPVESCLTCATPKYWSYWHLADGSWTYSQGGSSIYKVRNGAVEGWAWGNGDPPPATALDQICAPPPTDTPSPPTDTPIPPTDTPLPPTDIPAPPTATPTPSAPTATSPPPTPVVWFRLDANPVPAGACTNVRWDTSNAQEIYLDGERVSDNGSIEVCPTTHQEYNLRVVDKAGEQTHTLVLGVSGTAPATSAPELDATVTPSPTPAPIPQPTATMFSTPSPTLSSSPLPSPMPSPTPSPTAQPVAVVSPTPPDTPSPEPTSPSPPTPTPVRSAVSAEQPATSEPATSNLQSSTSTPSAAYVIFGLVAIGLLGLLASGTLRRRL